MHEPISGGFAESKTSTIVDDIKRKKTYQLRKQKEHNLELCIQVIAVVVGWLLCHHHYCSPENTLAGVETKQLNVCTWARMHVCRLQRARVCRCASVQVRCEGTDDGVGEWCAWGGMGSEVGA